VQEVSSLVADFEMLNSQSTNSFSPIPTSLLLSTYSSLQELQTSLAFVEMSRITYNLTITQCCEVLQSDINTNLFFRRMSDFDIWQFATKNRIPLSCFVLFDGECLNFSFWNSMKNDGNVSYLAKSQSPIREKLKATLRESQAINSALVSGKTLFPTTLVFYSPEKVGEGFVNSIANILSNLRVNKILALNELIVIEFAKRLARCLVGFDAFIQEKVIYFLTSLERINNSSLLFARRIQPELIHQQAHRRIAIC
jgi:hypothetical protein